MNDDSLDAYFAGFFDGEGHVGIYIDAQKHFLLKATLVNTNRPVLEGAVQRYGGFIHTRPPTTTWRATHNWHIHSQKAASFLRAIQPWSVVKAAEITVALEYADRCMGYRKGHGWQARKFTAEERALRESYRQRLKDIRGFYRVRSGVAGKMEGPTRQAPFQLSLS